ncbi:DUF4437 domain-containing protein [Pseudobdellovibrio sp. HCB154]|uniref:DUF4437 domain-containing protein n=1 Tax=Pseudobdellovibrio sp. HCB154 TaxID=3386277 RepID=UPI003916E176
MKKLSSIICITLALCATSAFAKDMATGKNKKAMENAVFFEAKDLQWKAAADLEGAQSAVVHGDPTKGAYHAFMKLKPGFSEPMHYHTADQYVTVLGGTIILTEKNGTEHRLPAGSYFSFVNKARHSTMCAQGAECLLFADIRGKWDVILEKENTISSK